MQQHNETANKRFKIKEQQRKTALCANSLVADKGFAYFSAVRQDETFASGLAEASTMTTSRVTEAGVDRPPSPPPPSEAAASTLDIAQRDAPLPQRDASLNIHLKNEPNPSEYSVGLCPSEVFSRTEPASSNPTAVTDSVLGVLGLFSAPTSYRDADALNVYPGLLNVFASRELQHVSPSRNITQQISPARRNVTLLLSPARHNIVQHFSPCRLSPSRTAEEGVREEGVGVASPGVLSGISNISGGVQVQSIGDVCVCVCVCVCVVVFVDGWGLVKDICMSYMSNLSQTCLHVSNRYSSFADTSIINVRYVDGIYIELSISLSLSPSLPLFLSPSLPPSLLSLSLSPSLSPFSLSLFLSLLSSSLLASSLFLLTDS